MRVEIERSLWELRNQKTFWAGAKATANRLLPNELDILEEYLDSIPGNDEPALTITQINDFLWFETDTICEILGITEDELYNREETPF